MTKNILYLSPYFWPEEIGSAPYCSELAWHLAEEGNMVRTVAFRPHYPSPEQFGSWAEGARDREDWHGVGIMRVPVSDRGEGGFKDRLKNDLGFLFYVLKRSFSAQLRQTDRIVAYVPSILTLYAAFWVRLITRAPIVCVVHDIESGLAHSLGITKSKMLLRIMRFVERVGLNRASHVVVLTDGMKEELQRVGCKRPISILPIWAEAVQEVKPVDPAAKPVVMYSGNFGKKQNLDQIVPLLKRLSDDKVAADVVLRGGGSERNRIEERLKSLKVDNVTFLPLIPAEQFLETLQSANIHLVPQALNVANYALPSKIVSIMSSGRPFICIAEKDSPLDRLAAESQAGICVTAGEEDALYKVVLDLLNDPDEQMRLGENGRAYVSENMNKNRILEAYGSLL